MSSAVDGRTNAGTDHLRVVVGLDFSDADGPAFDDGARLAGRVPGSELHLVHVFGAEPSEARSRNLVDHLRLYVNEKAAAAGGLGGMSVGIHLRAGRPVREIVQLAAEVHADLIVVGSHRRQHLRHWLFGSTAEKLSAGAACPVLVAHPRPAQSREHVIVIEPPCPDCVRAREVSHGAQWWCDRHANRVNTGHTFSYQRELPFASHDSAVIPTGVDF